MTNLKCVLRQYRWASRLTVRQMGKLIGVSGATISRIENGGDLDGETVRKILLWLMK